SRGNPGKLAFAPTGDLLAFYQASNEQQMVILWDTRTRSEGHHLRLGGALRDLTFTQDGRLFTADLSRSNNLTIWDITTGSALAQFTASVPVYSMGTVFNVKRDGSGFVHAISSPSHSVRLVDVASGTNSKLRVAEEL